MRLARQRGGPCRACCVPVGRWLNGESRELTGDQPGASTARREILGCMNEEVGPPLSEAEGRMLLNLLARHCAHEVDQWDTWRLSLLSGDFYVLIEDGMAPGGLPAERFHQVWPPRDLDTSA